MKFIVSSTSLLSHLNAVSKVINNKSTLPILECFLLDINDGKMCITAADTDIRLETSLDISGTDDNIKFAIEAKTLLDAIKELPEQPLTFDINVENLEVQISYHNGKYNLLGQNGGEFPLKRDLKENAIDFKINPETLLNGINRTIFASADDELRPTMNGIFFEISTENLTMVASDGHKLVKGVYSDVMAKENASFILPRKPALLMKSLLAKETEDLTFSFDENHAVIVMNNYTLTCRFIEGKYPNYQAVIPTNNINKAKFDRLAFISALKRVSVFSNTGTNLVKLNFTHNQANITAQDLDFSTSAEESLQCDYEGSSMKIGFKSTFLIEILNNIPSSDIVLEMLDASRAALLLPAEELDNEELLMLLMPMMLSE